MTDESELMTARDQWELVKKTAMSTGEKAAYVAEGVFESAVPVVGPALNRMAGVATGRHTGVADPRLMSFMDWLVGFADEINDALANLQDELDESEHPTSEDLLALFTAFQRASQSTSDPTKRSILKRAIINSFDPDEYRDGMTRVFLRMIERLEYGDIFFLAAVLEEVDDDQKARPIDMAVTTPDSARSKLLSGHWNMARWHLNRLEQEGLLQDRGQGLAIVVTVPGRRFLRFIEE